MNPLDRMILDRRPIAEILIAVHAQRNNLPAPGASYVGDRMRETEDDGEAVRQAARDMGTVIHSLASPDVGG